MKFDTASNAGLISRKNLFTKGRKVQVVTRLHCDVNFQKNLIPSNLDIGYILTPSRQQFVIQSFAAEDKVFKIKIEDAQLCVRKVKLTPERVLSFEKEIAKNELKIPISNVKMQTYTLSAGIKSFDKNGFFTGKLPEMCVFGFLDNDSYTGSYATNPFNFKNFNLSQIQFRYNGRAVPTNPLQLDYEGGSVYDGYISLYTGLNRLYFDASNGLTLNDYKHGNSLYSINFNSNTSCSHDDIAGQGSIDISLKFNSGLPNAVTLVVYSAQDSAIIIDQFRNVILES